MELADFQDWCRRNTLARMTDEYLNKEWKRIMPHPRSPKLEKRDLSNVYEQLHQLRETQQQLLQTNERLLSELQRLNEVLSARAS